ncbi:hypothetical protein R3P82_12715 [Dietzia maris]|uniref:Uncharacterized protein n=1 Tax=Dietzia maris TaxID=37915 RepID=A0AAE4QYU6_9ACTN|nr:hypothetical protein [Dietzia maris]MDV6299972.1 hypothetical protein [Dietzia maris]
MSTTIKSENGVGISVGQLGISVVHPEGITSIWARLSPEQRGELAAALAQAPTPTRPNNPADCAPDRVYMGTVNGKREVMRRVPGRELPWETFANVHADASVSDLVPLVETHTAADAEQLIPRYAMLDIWGALGRDPAGFDQWYDQVGYADAWAYLVGFIHRINGADPVSRADIDRALINVTSNVMNYPAPAQMLGKDSGPLRRKCVDAMCDLLGIEAEQDVDPVKVRAEELAREIWKGLEPEGGPWIDYEDAHKPGGHDGVRMVDAVARYLAAKEASGDE